MASLPVAHARMASINPQRRGTARSGLAATPRAIARAARPLFLTPLRAALSSTPATPPPPPTAHTDTEWLQEQLNEVLAGLESATRRARVRALRVLHVTGARMSYSPSTQRPRCTGLDLDIEFSAEPLAPGGAPGGRGAPAVAAGSGKPLHGMARVKLQTAQGCDKVLVTDVQVLEDDEEGGDGAPCMPSGKAAPPEVLLAVQSLDGTIMEHLNSWMWEMEQAEAGKFPLSSFELDEDAAAREGTLTQAPSFDAAALLTPGQEEEDQRDAAAPAGGNGPTAAA